MALKQRIKDALDEARMVVLVVQVLLGFQFSVVLEHRFDGLSAVGQDVHLAGLGCLLIAFALAVAPATFHRIAEGGNDTPRVLRFTSRMVGWALLPFSAAIGASLFVVMELIGMQLEAVLGGIVGFLVATTLWYLGPFLSRRRSPAEMESNEARSSAVEAKIEHTLTEARMVLPGAQALLGFQFMAFFASGFAELPRSSRLVHFGGLVCVSLAGVLLIAPAAFHRIAEHGESTARFYRYASGMVEASLVPLAIGMSADFYVIVAKVTGSATSGIWAAVSLVVGAGGLWWGVPWVSRTRPGSRSTADSGESRRRHRRSRYRWRVPG